MRFLIFHACIFVGFLSSIPALFAQTYVSRANYSQFLEPEWHIFHGAGQDPQAFLHYWEVMDESEKPIVYMHYEGLNNIGSFWARDLKEDLMPFKNQMIVIQLGLELVGQTEAIVRGELDDDIKNWLDGIEELGLPVYARLGYEFNGFDWNRYEPEPYKAAFIYLVEKIRERDLEIATVWNYVPDPTQPSNFMDFYPGDEYVDWWSINIFEPTQIGNTLTKAFLDSAHVHSRPVLIGESTPKDIGVLDGAADWDAWFEPFFNLVAAESGIKMTGYINWDWGNYPQWSTWGDARLEQNDVVSQLFNDEMNEEIFAHAGSERDYRLQLGREEDQLPGQVKGLIITASTIPVAMSWDPVNDESAIARYLIYDKDELVDFTGKTSTSLHNVVPGDTLALAVVAVDRAGNQGEPSERVTLVIDVPETPRELILNGQFDSGKNGWNLTEFVSDVAGAFEIDSSGVLDGPNSAHITIFQNTGTNWHLQLEQPLSIAKNHRYALAYQVRSNAPTTLEMWLQEAEHPFTGYAQRTIDVTPDPKVFYDTVFVAVDDDVFMRFMLGTAGTSEIWIDGVSVQDLGEVAQTSTFDYSGKSIGFEVALPYPNPATSVVRVEYTLPQPGLARVDVYDMLGRQINNLVDQVQSAGKHRVEWSAKVAAGVYMIRVEYNSDVQTRKVILVR